MPEDLQEQLARVRLMASGDPTWDLSDNDLAALTSVLARIADLEREVARLTEENHAD